MKLTVTIDKQMWNVVISEPIDLSIALDFYGPQPSAFSLAEASSAPVSAGSFVGDTRLGGSANCETISLNPHANGTHTEGVGHISLERYAVSEALCDSLIPATVITVQPEIFGESSESYDGISCGEDRVITRRQLSDALKKLGYSPGFMDAVIVRTLPNATTKMQAHHSGSNPVYFTNDAMKWVCEANIRHVLVDIPSVDREEDGGKLSNHRIFWDLAHGQSIDLARKHATITEMIYVPERVEDGVYLLNLQIPNFVLDAAPSRPVLFRLQPEKTAFNS